MKKLFFMLFLLLLVTETTFAQGLSYGVKAGVNRSTITGMDEKNRIGFVGGGFAAYRWPGWIALQGELLYSQQGAMQGANYDYLLSLDYLNVAVMANFYLVNGFNFQAGMQPGFLLRAQRETAQGAVKMDCRTFSLNYALGIGFDYGRFTSSLRYTLGANTINPRTSPLGVSENSVFQLMVGWRFGPGAHIEAAKVKSR